MGKCEKCLIKTGCLYISGRKPTDVLQFPCGKVGGIVRIGQEFWTADKDEWLKDPMNPHLKSLKYHEV